MFAFPDQFVALQRQSFESAQAIALASFAGFEKLTQLNVQAAKASLEENVQKGVSLFETKDIKALADSFADSAQPASDKFTAYARHVYEIANETGTEISKVVEQQFAEGNRQLTAAIEAVAKNSPAGSEGVVTLVKSAVTAANATWDQVNKASRQVVEMTEANVANATNAARVAAAAAPKRKAA
jgi:phasin family protein